MRKITPVPRNIKIASSFSGSIQYSPAVTTAIMTKIKIFLRIETCGLNQNSSMRLAINHLKVKTLAQNAGKNAVQKKAEQLLR